jgi:chromosome segregation protein
MYLKSIELCGFKSFADKTRLEFDKNLTAIIGPNGCGKSNVVDAIRWCLGEQSAYSLRTPQMMGIIFGGSQTRSPLGLAEASLTFDNTSSILPMDYTEITVTRKIFRSGESEYYINKTQCRLKDVRDLFLDTGIGRSGYSIFEQGKVEFIINAKPEERRGLFEEAAGVAKYKVRREETLRKLEKVRDDMNRVNDIMSVIKEQTTTLESQVRKARLYQKYVEELKTLQVADLVKKIDKLSGELAPLSSNLEKLNKEIISRTTKSDTFEAALSGVRFDLTRHEKEKGDASARLSAIDREIAQSEERCLGFGQMSAEFAQRRETLAGTIKEVGNSSVELKQRIDKIISEQDNFSPAINEARQKYALANEEHSRIRGEISSLQSATNRLNASILDIINKKSSVSNEIAGVESEIAAFSGSQGNYARDLKKVGSERDALLSEITAINEKISAVKSVFESENRKAAALKAATAKTSEKLAALRTEYQSLKEKHITLEARAGMLSDLQKKDPKTRGVYAVMSRNFPGVYGTVSSLIDISGVNENAVAGFLGDKLNYVVCSTLRDAEEAIEYLRSNSLGYAAFIVEELLPEPPKFKELFSSRSEKTIASMVKYEPRWAKLARFLFDDSYAASGRIRSESIIFGGDTSGAALPEIEIKAIEEEMTAAFGKVKAFESEIKSLESSLAGTEESLKSINPKLEENRITIASLENSLNDKNRNFELLNLELETIEKEIARLRNESERKNASLKPLRTETVDLEKRIKAARKETAKNDGLLDGLREKEAAANPELTARAQELSALEERAQSYEREKETLLSNLKMSAEQAERSRVEIESLGKKIVGLAESGKKEKAHHEELHKDKTRVEKDVSGIQLAYVRVFEKQSKIEEQLSLLRQELKDFEEKRHEVQITMRGKEIEKNSFEKQLAETGIGFAEAKESYIGMEIEEGQIERLKRRIESMGAVNMAAQDEYTNLESRYNFLLNQQQDLLKAEEDLRSAIYKINNSIRETFQSSFEQVRTNFKSLFGQLFEGGEADIVLTDENNLLESGIDIYAQPPGKKLQSIAQCSGGENALTAIALVFAFFMVKPSPVCVLDEVDAPLDDANVTRFINLVRSFMQNSQFLVITHNKKTAEAADNIYGVTMEEFGISKIYSLKIQKSESTLEKENAAAEEVARK